MGYITFSQGKSTGKPLLVKSANSMFRKYSVGKPTKYKSNGCTVKKRWEGYEAEIWSPIFLNLKMVHIVVVT